MFTIKYTLVDGSVRFDSVACMATALFCAVEFPVENAVRVEVRGQGFYQAWRLR
jgi:hypothetical protein